MKITFSAALKTKADMAVIVLPAGALKAPKMKGQKALQAVLDEATTTGFKGNAGQTYIVNGCEACDYKRVVFLGLGKDKDLSSCEAENIGGKLYAAIGKGGYKKAHLVIAGAKPSKSSGLTLGTLAAHVGYGAALRSYEYTKHKKKPKEAQTKLEALAIEVQGAGDLKAAKAQFKILDAVLSGVFTARDLVNDPPNMLYPESFADIAKDRLKPLGVSVEILDDKKMTKLGMGGIIGVGQGSVNKPRMVIMRWNGDTSAKAKKAKPIALVGKGVTFDTGGISIKPGAGMDEMKMDMGGAAAVVGTMNALALRKAKVNVVAVIGLAENMPSSNAYKPADILTTYSGKTIEVLNTDAEGRVVLADCLEYVQDKYSPSTIIDLATLTGAMMVALGHEYCGTFANDNGLWSELESASSISGEKLWRMPLDKAWNKAVEGNFGDVANLSKIGRYAGACTAAAFLEYFIDDGVKWAHMDIAGPAWVKGDLPTAPKFGTGFGVRVLSQWIADHYEG
jgi:leucyl aminopeptidase